LVRKIENLKSVDIKTKDKLKEKVRGKIKPIQNNGDYELC
jgi:hypothetical protein